jgi:hypothetical protein
MRIWRIRMLHGVNAVKLKSKGIAILAESMYQEMEGSKGFMSSRSTGGD